MSRPTPRDFTEEEFDYYSRQIVLRDFGVEGQRKLKNALVCVIGAGGLGSSILTQLASIGIGTLRLVDRDIVEISNLQRQQLYGINVVGVPKVEAAESRLTQINPFIKVESIPLSITQSNAEQIIQESDIVVDALDSMRARYAVNKACQRLKVPFIYGAVITQLGSATTIIPGKTACLECFQGGIDDESLPSCAVQGVHPSIIGLIASIQVSEVVKLILGENPVLANNLLFADLKDLSIEKIKLAKADGCPVCGLNPIKEHPLFKQSEMEEVCGREGRRVFIFSPEDDMKLDLREINHRIESEGYKVLVKARMGITFIKNEVRGSILSSGVTILEGYNRSEKAKQLRDLLLKGNS